VPNLDLIYTGEVSAAEGLERMATEVRVFMDR